MHPYPPLHSDEPAGNVGAGVELEGPQSGYQGPHTESKPQQAQCWKESKQALQPGGRVQQQSGKGPTGLHALAETDTTLPLQKPSDIQLPE